MPPHAKRLNPNHSRPRRWSPVALFRLAALWLMVPMLTVPRASASDHKSAPPARPAIEYPAYDDHPAEHVTIAAEPCDEPKQCSFFRLEYIQHGLLPVRVVISNESDQALSLDDARIHLLPASGDRIQAATEDDINRRLFTIKGTQATHIPLTPLQIHHAPVDKKITEDMNDFGFVSTTVQPHTTAAGYVFYDIRDLDDLPLKHAEIYVKMVHTLDGKKELFPFTVPLDKWLAAHPEAASNSPRR